MDTANFDKLIITGQVSVAPAPVGAGFVFSKVVVEQIDVDALNSRRLALLQEIANIEAILGAISVPLATPAVITAVTPDVSMPVIAAVVDTTIKPSK